MSEKTSRDKTNRPDAAGPGRLGPKVSASALLLLIAAVSWGQPASGAGMSGFEEVAFELALQGRVVSDARVLQSQQSGALLVMTSELVAPVLIRLRERTVETVNLMKVSENGDGTIDLLPEATLAPQGSYQLNADQTGVTFSVEGRSAEIREKPPLLGDQDPEGLSAYDPSYGRSAEAYTPSMPIVERLGRIQGDVQVVVYFGTWCPFCKQMIPRMMRVARELSDSGIDFQFYGLPRSITGDPKARQADIEGVPTGLVFVDGKEVGRIQGNSWKVPELALNNLLRQSIPSS